MTCFQGLKSELRMLSVDGISGFFLKYTCTKEMKQIIGVFFGEDKIFGKILAFSLGISLHSPEIGVCQPKIYANII